MRALFRWSKNAVAIHSTIHIHPVAVDKLVVVDKLVGAIYR